MLRPRIGHVRRVAAPAAAPGALDAILVSHVHHDHLDSRSLAQLRSGRVVVPRGAERHLEHRGFESVVSIGEGEEIAFGACAVVATHAEHGARRLPWTREIPALGYLIRGSRVVYFAGDTDVFEAMRDVAPAIDVALLPVAGWGPRVGPGHLDPRRAAEALRLLKPRVAIPIHWGTYRRFGLASDAATLHEPAAQFERLAAELAPEVEVRVLEPGGRAELSPHGAAAAGGVPC